MQIYRNKDWRNVNENPNGEVLIPFKTKPTKYFAKLKN